MTESKKIPIVCYFSCGFFNQTYPLTYLGKKRNDLNYHSTFGVGQGDDPKL